MYLFAALAAIIGSVAGIILAARTKKADGVVYGKLDKLGRITNLVLIPVYIVLALYVTAVSMFMEPEYDGILGVLGWIACFIMASAPMFCGLGLGYSVSLRKKGKSKLSFLAQFSGVVSCALSIGLFMLLYDNLLSSLN